MKRVIPIFLILLVISVVLISIPSYVNACSCIEPLSVAEEFERSEAVFTGKVLSIKDRTTSNGFLSKHVLFEVDEVWKGIDETQVFITTGVGGGDCGYGFELGMEYLVYAQNSNMYGKTELVTIICDGTKALDEGQEDIAFLEKGQKPQVEVQLHNSEPLKDEIPMIGLFLAIILLLVIFVVLNLRKNKK